MATTKREIEKTMPATRILGAAILALILTIAAFGASSARAEIVLQSSFGGAGTGPGQFAGLEGNPAGIAINESTGDVYVVDKSNHRVQQFTANGTFIRMWGQGVNQTTTGDICPVNPGDVCGAGSAGGAAGAFNSPLGIGIDNSGGPSSGSVYVQDGANNRVQKFTADGQFLLTWGMEVNLDTGADLCTAASGDTCKPGNVSGKIATAKEKEEEKSDIPSEPGRFAGWNTSGFLSSPDLGVDGSGYVYVGDSQAVPDARIQKFDSNGSFVGQIAGPSLKFGEKGISTLLDFDVNANGDVFVADSRDAVERYDADDFTPDGLTAAYTQLYNQVFGSRFVAIDPSNQYLFIGGNQFEFSKPGNGSCSTLGYHIIEYHPNGQEVDCTIPTSPNLNGLSGLAISTEHKLYASVGFQVRIYAIPQSEAPVVGAHVPSAITSQSAVIKADVTGNLSDTEIQVEYGTAPCSSNPCTTTADSEDIGASVHPLPGAVSVEGLQPATTYYYRVLATNGEGSDTSTDGHFITFSGQTFDPACANNLARQQTGAALLFDCRAYELVSAEDQGGYNVVSDLIPGQVPFGGYPGADGKALYAVDSGGIPNAGKPTNRGPDPYVASRDPDNQRWNTEYVGIPADAPSAEPFSSTVAGADDGLFNFAFGGDEICDPCFEDGSVGVPLHDSEGNLGQGMVGSVPVAEPKAAGEIRKRFSADGSHLIFGSMQKFEPTANESGTDLTIYDRDLKSGTTQVVSTLPDGETILAGDEIAELDVSNDGSRILIGQLVDTDSAGNERWHLYMHLGASTETIDLTPGATSGVLYAGMSSDGSQVLFSTPDPLTTTEDQDTDSSADLFRAEVSGSTATLSRVSVGSGGTGDTDLCDPAANSYNPEDWNVIPGGPTDCSVVAVRGAGGVAADNGTVYFLSPEKLDGDGVEGAPNLFLARPGEAPQFAVTLESSASNPLLQGAHQLQQSIGSFTNPGGAAIDATDGSIYVHNLGDSTFSTAEGSPNASIQKFDSSGSPDPNFGNNSVLGGLYADGRKYFELPTATPTSIAVDNSGSANSGDLYVLDDSNLAKRFSSSGVLEDTFKVGDGYVIDPEKEEFFFEVVTGIAVDPANGHVYVSTAHLFGFSTVYVFDTNGNPVAPTSFSVSHPAIGIAVDSSGNVYVSTGSNTELYNSSGAFIKTFAAGTSYGVSVDPADDHVYIDKGDQVVEYDSSGAQASAAFGSGILSGSIGLGAQSGKVAVSNKGSGNVALFGPPTTPPSRGYDNPLVIDSVRSPETPESTDFQLTPSGDHAVFPSALSLTGFENGEKHELFRYDALADQIDCASCNPTDIAPLGDATLASDGLSISADGRVFFNTSEPLALSDTNSKRDAYEWKEGKLQLISTGKSAFDSGLLSISKDGTDAFFFTRETLAPNDTNGKLMKLYTARQDGGFFVIPPPPQCAASDECHGPSSQPPAPAAINTAKGTRGNVKAPLSCKRGQVKRSGKCVKRKQRGNRKRARKRNHAKTTSGRNG